MTNYHIPQIARNNIIQRVTEILDNAELVQGMDITIHLDDEFVVTVEYDITELIPNREVNNND